MTRRLACLVLAVLTLGLALAYHPDPLGGVAFSKEPGSKDNFDLLARAVAGEAKGEPYEGQVAVAAVILNRVDSKEFPNSVAGVIFQPLAFESVANGEIWRALPASSRRAARDALNGMDPSGGCLFFFNPAKTKNRYIWSRPQVRRIGKHIFAR